MDLRKAENFRSPASRGAGSWRVPNHQQAQPTTNADAAINSSFSDGIDSIPDLPSYLDSGISEIRYDAESAEEVKVKQFDDEPILKNEADTVQEEPKNPLILSNQDEELSNTRLVIVKMPSQVSVNQPPVEVANKNILPGFETPSVSAMIKDIDYN